MPIHQIPSALEHRHALPDQPFARESLVWVVPLPQEGLSAFVYTWVNGRGEASVAATAFGASLPEPILESSDADVPREMDFNAWQFGPLALTANESLSSGHIRFDGERLAFDLEFTGFHPTYGYAANDSKCPPFWADDRTEQGGRVVGTLRIDERQLAVDAFGHRDHSWGTRDWGVIQHMKWINALAHPEISVHVMQIQALGHTSLHGYVHKDGDTSSVVEFVTTYDLDAELRHTTVDATIVDEAGRTTTLHLTGGAGHLVWAVSPHLNVHDVAMHAEIDGQPGGVAYVDMSWPEDYTQRFRRAGRNVSIPLASVH